MIFAVPIPSRTRARLLALTMRRTRGYGSSRSSTVSPSTQENSRVLFVAGINSAWGAWPAMSTSKGPIPLPA